MRIRRDDVSFAGRKPTDLIAGLPCRLELAGPNGAHVHFWLPSESCTSDHAQAAVEQARRMRDIVSASFCPLPAGMSPWPFEVRLCARDLIRAIATGGSVPLGFVWPDEGAFDDTGVWRFSGEYDTGFEPLLLDRFTASNLLTLHNALGEENASKMREWVEKDRAHFGHIMESMWEFNAKGRRVSEWRTN